jgi:transposase
MLFPIEFSREFHQQEYLENGIPKSAKLIMRRDEEGNHQFFVNIAFEFHADPIEPVTVLGIDRGWSKIASCTLIGMDRKVVQSGIDMEGKGFFDQQKNFEKEISKAQQQGKKIGRRFRVRGRAGDNALGEFANRLVAFALEHKSQIVIEKLNALAMSRFLRRSQIAKLKMLLDYKTDRVGLPKPIEVSAAYSSQTCTRCGHKAKENRPKKDDKGNAIQHVFKCVKCGYEANADHNASHFLALRGLHRIESKAANARSWTFDDFLEWLV